MTLLTIPTTELLTPGALNTQAEAAVKAFFHEGQSRNTARTYKTALQYWGAWHALRYGAPLTAPVPAATVIQFIVDHLEHNPDMAAPNVTPFSKREDTTQHLLPLLIDQCLVDRAYKAKLGPWTLSTVKTRLAALSKAHEIYRIDNPHLNLGPDANPLRDPKVRQLVSAAARAYARRGRAPRKPAAATRSVMEALLATCGDDLPGIRDRALLLFGWASGGRRRSEIAAASFENIRTDGDGYVYELNVSKTNQTGAARADSYKPIQGIAAEALRRWFEVLLKQKITQGQIFRQIVHGEVREPLIPGTVRVIIRRRARMANQPLGHLSAHSLRSGFVTEAATQNIALAETMALTGHRSVQTVIGYYRAGEVGLSRAGRLLDEKVGKP
jgi:integrase